jgi:hypothetical protein
MVIKFVLVPDGGWNDSAVESDVVLVGECKRLCLVGHIAEVCQGRPLG